MEGLIFGLLRYAGLSPAPARFSHLFVFFPPLKVSRDPGLALFEGRNSGFSKQNEGEIRDRKYARDAGCRNNHQDYGIFKRTLLVCISYLIFFLFCLAVSGLHFGGKSFGSLD